MGAQMSVVLSPTPPVECLSTFFPAIAERSTRSPESAMAIVSAVVSSAVMPLNQIAISMADIW